MTTTPSLIIVADRILTGPAHFSPRAHQGVAIADGVIVVVDDADRLTARWSSVPVQRYGNSTVLPGLIDCHVHLTFPGDGSNFEEYARAPLEIMRTRALQNARDHLAGGVTTLRDVGSPAGLLNWRDPPSPDLPRIIAYGPPITAPRGHMYLLGGECDSPASVAAMAQHNLERGADGIKVVASGGGTVGTVPHEATLSVEQIQAAVEVAHRHGAIVTSHALASESVRRSLEAGVDGIEHVAFLDSSGRSNLTSDLADHLVETQVPIGGTIGANYRYLQLVEQERASPERFEAQRIQSEYSEANAATLHRLGARFVAASDAGWRYTSFGDIATELERMVAAGMAESFVIESATAGAADALRLPRLGRIAEGYEADLLIVSGDPLQRISDIRSVLGVYRAGSPVLSRNRGASSTTEVKGATIDR